MILVSDKPSSVPWATLLLNLSNVQHYMGKFIKLKRKGWQVDTNGKSQRFFFFPVMCEIPECFSTKVKDIKNEPLPILATGWLLNGRTRDLHRWNKTLQEVYVTGIIATRHGYQH